MPIYINHLFEFITFISVYFCFTIRYELVAFVKAINSKKDLSNIRQSVSETVCEVVEDFYGRKEMMLL